MLFVLGDWRLRTDPAENARGKVPYLCGCQSCRNFLAAVETLRHWVRLSPKVTMGFTWLEGE